MTLHNQAILEEYKANLETYNVMAEVIRNTLKGFLSGFGELVNSIECRVKTYDSLAGKLELKGEKYQSIEDITDIVGSRVVVFYADKVDKFAALVEKNFDIDWENSVDRRKLYKVDQFGYLSLHYICRIPESIYKDDRYPKLNNFRFEIQLRSTLQHVWASIYHDTGYKNDVEVPREYLRNLNRLAGLLELADDNFVQIRNSIDEYKRKVKQVVKSGDLSTVELNIDSFNAYLESHPFDHLNNKIATINNMEIEYVSLRNFLPVYKALRFQTLKEVDDFIKEYTDLAYEFAIRQFNGKDIDIITSATGPLTLLVVYILSKGMGEEIVKQLLDTIYGNRKSNARQAKRYAQIGYSMGLNKKDEDIEDGQK